MNPPSLASTLSTPPVRSAAAEELAGSRVADSSICDLWLIDHAGDTVMKCRCLESNGADIRLRMPLGYGVAEGQRYELRSCLPGEHGGAGPVVNSRWGTVVRTRLQMRSSGDYVDVGMTLDPQDASSLRFVC